LALGLVWAGTRAQSGDRYGSDMLHPGKVLRGSLPLLSPLGSLCEQQIITHTLFVKQQNDFPQMK